MACRGVLFAINDDDSTFLLKCKNDAELIDYIQETIEDRWEEDWLSETDKAWDAIHRCFADGKLEFNGGSLPLNSIIFGGNMLNSGPDYLVSYKSKSLVAEIASKITDINKEKFNLLYDNISSDYDGELSDDDFEYSWAYFEDIAGFYEKCSSNNREVIFTVDQ